MSDKGLYDTLKNMGEQELKQRKSLLEKNKNRMAGQGIDVSLNNSNLGRDELHIIDKILSERQDRS